MTHKKEAAQTEANINFDNMSLSELDNLQTTLLNKETADQFLNKVISFFTSDDARKEIQLRLAVDAVNAGATIDFSQQDIYLSTLENLQSVLFTEGTADQFLNKVISSFPDDDEKEIQTRLAVDAVNAGATIDFSQYMSLSTLENLQSVLLTEETADQFLNKVIALYCHDDKKEIQMRLAVDAVNAGATIDFSQYMSLSTLENLQSALFTEGTADQFLNKVISSFPDDDGKEIQTRLAVDAVNAGATIDFSQYMSLSTLENLQSVLLTEETADQFLNKVIALYCHDDKKEIQMRLAVDAVNAGATIDFSQQYMSLSMLENLQSVLLTEEAADQFLAAVLKASIHDYNSDTQHVNVNLVYIEIQKNLIKEALDKGADINIAASMDFETLSANRSLFFNHPKSTLTADNFLKLILTARSMGEADSQLVLELLEYAISLGADVNISVDTGVGQTTPLAMTEDEDIANFLEAHGAKCGIDSDIAAEFFQQEIFSKYPFGFSEFFKTIGENPSAPKKESIKIPSMMHHVWLTHPSSPREIDPLDIEIVLHNQDILEKDTMQWKHIVWTNNKSLIENSTLTLEGYGVEVKEIGEYQMDLRLFDVVTEFSNQKSWGLASDILRYSLVEHFGGVYADLNFKFARSVEDELYTYDFFAQDFVNYFFAAKPEHPILSSLLGSIESNVLNPASYIQNIDASDILMKTVYLSLFPLGLAYLNASNKDGNTDIIYPDSKIDIEGEWLNNAGKCISFFKFLRFSSYSEVCGSEDLLVGHDGANGLCLTWMEE